MIKYNSQYKQKIKNNNNKQGIYGLSGAFQNTSLQPCKERQEIFQADTHSYPKSIYEL